jgi:hypothetical protein
VSAATVHGFSVAFAVAGGILGLALIVVAIFINAPAGSGSPEVAPEPTGNGAPVFAPAQG